jgi:hypothetical protein
MSLLVYVYWLQLHIEFVLGKHLVADIPVGTQLGSLGSGLNYRQVMRRMGEGERNKRQGRQKVEGR